ncbi:A24 family peptidase [Haloechinothrix salitolerans]|uniref:Prepilin peptidase n=1 Tax=Haloechinothrix salitolerans TaxID=926830 RepID=A0ABW2C3N9_9PSEU
MTSHAGYQLMAIAALLGCIVLRWVTDALPAWWLPVPIAITLLGVPLAATDLRQRRLPNALTLSAIGVTACVLVAVAVSAGTAAVLGAAAWGGVSLTSAHLAVYLVAPGSLGGGDVKLATSVGAVLGAVGWQAVLLGMLLASSVAFLLGVAARVLRRPAWRDGVPYGPGLLAATWAIAVFPWQWSWA